MTSKFYCQPLTCYNEYESKFVLFNDSNNSKDIYCHLWPYFFIYFQSTQAEIRPQVKWAFNLLIAYGHFIAFKLTILSDNQVTKFDVTVCDDLIKDDETERDVTINLYLS